MVFRETPVLALIPARSGSKTIKNKNMVEINGFPLIYYTIQAAIKSKFIDHIFVSTDDLKIKKYLVKFPSVSLINRPKNISADNSKAQDVVSHFFKLNLIKKIHNDPFLVYLQPTSPMRKAKHIDLAFNKLEIENNDKLVSVCKNTISPYKSFRISNNKKIKTLFKNDKSNFNKQKLPDTVYANGAIYIFRKKIFQKKCEFPNNNSSFIIMNYKEGIDIDSKEDLAILKSLFN